MGQIVPRYRATIAEPSKRAAVYQLPGWYLSRWTKKVPSAHAGGTFMLASRLRL